MKCECNCGNEGDVILKLLGTKPSEYKLCMNCHLNITNCNLSKKQFKALIDNGHTIKEFLLHEDFYDEEGNALQPH